MLLVCRQVRLEYQEVATNFLQLETSIMHPRHGGPWIDMASTTPLDLEASDYCYLARHAKGCIFVLNEACIMRGTAEAMREAYTEVRMGEVPSWDAMLARTPLDRRLHQRLLRFSTTDAPRPASLHYRHQKCSLQPQSRPFRALQSHYRAGRRLQHQSDELGFHLDTPPGDHLRYQDRSHSSLAQEWQPRHQTGYQDPPFRIMPATRCFADLQRC